MVQFPFKYDLENIEKVQNYVIENYEENVDYKMWIGRGDDIMNFLKVLSDKLLNDIKFRNLVSNCIGYNLK